MSSLEVCHLVKTKAHINFPRDPRLCLNPPHNILLLSDLLGMETPSDALEVTLLMGRKPACGPCVNPCCACLRVHVALRGQPEEAGSPLQPRGPRQQIRSSGLTVSASALRAILLALGKYFYGVSLLLILVTAMLEVSFYFKKCPIVWLQIYTLTTRKNKKQKPHPSNSFANRNAYPKVPSGESHTQYSSFCSFFLPHTMNQ